MQVNSINPMKMGGWRSKVSIILGVITAALKGISQVIPELEPWVVVVGALAGAMGIWGVANKAEKILVNNNPPPVADKPKE